MTTTFAPKTTFGQDTIYVCTNPSCNHREKQFSVPDRNTTPCQKCNSVALKSTIMEKYDYMNDVETSH